MNIDIAICTWNRAKQLEKTLERLASLNSSACSSLRVIIVNNCSTDNTAEIIQPFGSSLNICSLSEERQGHAFARNNAVTAAEGDLLLWIDDDVLVGDDWPDAYVRAAKRQPEVSFWGGPILPVFDHDEPEWIRENWTKLSGCFAWRDLGESEIKFTRALLPYGANFAIRTNVQKKYLYNADSGRTGTAVDGEDELDLFRQLLDDGHTGKWIPEAGVDHIIDSTRTTTEYIGSYFTGQGRALAARGESWTNELGELEREMRHELLCFKTKRYFSKSEVWLSHLIRGSLAKGQAEAIARSLELNNG